MKSLHTAALFECIQVANKQEIMPGSSEEIEIRGCTIAAVDRLCAAIEATFGAAATPHALQLDWWLWERGERTRGTAAPHHRTHTIYY